MTRNNRENQYVRFCPECGGRVEWQRLTNLECREEGFPESLLGYFFCAKCGSQDRRGTEERWPGTVTETKSTAFELGMAADTLKRLCKKDPSFSFIINEGGKLISYSSSLSAQRERLEEEKRADRRENVENYKGWFGTAPSSTAK